MRHDVEGVFQHPRELCDSSTFNFLMRSLLRDEACECSTADRPTKRVCSVRQLISPELAGNQIWKGVAPIAGLPDHLPLAEHPRLAQSQDLLRVFV